MPQHILLAYSGGLDTSVGIHWLKNQFNAEVTAVLIDVGQPIPGIEDAKARALHNGAKACIIVEAKQVFAEQYLVPAIQANAMYEGAYPLATALARPLIAKCLVDLAAEHGADAVAHGCTGKGNDQVRIEAGIKALAPHLQIIAPQRSHPMSRDEVLRYAAKNNLMLPPAKKSPYSVDENLWGRSAEGHDAEDPANPVPEAAYAWTSNPQTAKPAGVSWTFTFQNGIPTKLNGKPADLVSLIAQVNAEAGTQGIGRIDHVENRLVGIKTREVYEAPAATVILAAKKALETICLTRDEFHLKPTMEQAFSTLVYDGKWFHPVRNAVQAFTAEMQQHVNGEVTMKAVQGTLQIMSRTSQNSLFDSALATYSDGDAFHHQAAEGFIEIWALSQQVAHKARTPATQVLTQ